MIQRTAVCVLLTLILIFAGLWDLRNRTEVSHRSRLGTLWGKR